MIYGKVGARCKILYRKRHNFYHNNCMLGYVTRLSMVQCMSVANMVLFVLGCFVFTLNRMNISKILHYLT